MFYKNKCVSKRMVEYWLDDNENGKFVPIKMPYKYVIEMFCDMVGASKTYLRTSFTSQSPLDYYNAKCKGKRIMHIDSTMLLEDLLLLYASYNDEKAFFKWYKNNKKHIIENYNRR